MVFGLFSKERSLQRTIDKAINKLSQQPDRWAALEKLREDGSEEALFGLCKRFGVTSMKGVEDEQEKNWVVDVLVEKGASAWQPLTRYMKGAEQLSFPLRALERTADHDRILKLVDEIFASEPPGYARFPDRRIDLIKWFTEWKDATEDEVLSRVLPYLTDFDENVRFTAIDGVSSRDPKKIVGPLVDALIRPEEESGRIRRTVIEVLERTKAPLGARAKDVATMLSGPLGDGYKVDGEIVKRR
jgi:HEAT repeat protein